MAGQRRPRKERVTLTQVAKKAGYSASTVSLVLNNRPGTRIPEETAKHIRRVARSLGYKPDVAARGLRTGRSEAIGFISNEVTVTRFASAMITGVVETSQDRNHAVLMAECPEVPYDLEVAVQAILDRRVDALIMGLMRARQVEFPDLPAKMPFVVTNGIVPGHPSVLPDEFAGGRSAVQYLVERGHTRIGLIGRAKTHLNPEVSVTIGDRFRGIDSAMEESRLAFTEEFHGSDWEPDLGSRGAGPIIDSGATAVVCANDRIAFGVYQACLKRGIRIPEDLSVISFDNEQLASYLTPGLTTVEIPYRTMGQAATRLVLDAVRKRSAPAGSREAGAPAADAVAATKLDGDADPATTDGIDAAVNSMTGTSAISGPAPIRIHMPLIERESVRHI